VVDDDDATRELIGFHLEDRDVVVETAPDGEACLRRLADGGPAPDAVVLDLRMPGTDGFETLRRIGWDVPTLVLSGQEGEREKLRAFELGAIGYVTKPFSPAVLVARLVRHFEVVDRGPGGWPPPWEPARPGER